MPEEVIKGFGDLGGSYLVPVNWGMFNMSLHKRLDPVEEVTMRSKQNKIQVITHALVR
jgi:hypothetical protein